jgi:LacI family transcriptional regulator
MSSRPAVTLDAIAAEAGVSKWTVARVLNGENKETWPSAKARAEQIRAIATRLGYRPNTAAKAVRTGRFGAIGLVFGVHSTLWLPPGLLRQLQRHAAEADWNLLVSTFTPEQLASDELLPKLLRELAVDGLVLDLIDQDLTALDAILRRHRIPAVALNVDRPHDCVRFDDHAGFAQAVARLAAHGLERIGYRGQEPADESHYSLRHRIAGYRAGMAAAGLAEDLLLLPGGKDPERLATLRRWLDRPDRPQAVLAQSGREATEVYAAALQLGLKLPRDLQLVTTSDGSLDLPGFEPEILLLDQRPMAAAAIAMLQRKIAEPERPQPTEAIPLKHE